jgi:hypothetical protein
MSLETLSDETVLRAYESIRKEVAADLQVPQRVLGETAKQRAEQLSEEITRHRLEFSPIDWPF